ncbi:hypothetical protein [Cellulomonas cellasea]|uniref:Uncharacterized protein n=1 Tax=Cellulomonas cellasea TaxID=43670 RepID=A0A7W4UCV6_9CELL|nr:hypothetical protein [Cellulomonas cellasea]MBB2921867.1 hypothetical protein [Cellulomonas cellasea]
MHPVLQLLVVVAMLAVSVFGGWVLTSGVLRLAGRSSDAGTPGDGTPPGGAGDGSGGPAPDTVSDGPDGERARAALRGGTWIGILERLAVTGMVLVGENEGVALVLAVKGLGRYPELRENPGASERFVIGTLASLLWAGVVGYAGRELLFV